MILHLGDLPAGQLLDILQIFLFAKVAEGDCNAAEARPAGSADAVDVGLRLVGQIVIDHMGQLIDVNASRRNVGRHQNARFARLEVGQGVLARALRLVPVYHAGGDPRPVQRLFDPVRAVLGPREDQRGDNLFILHQQVDEQLPLISLVHEVDELGDALHRGGDGRHRDRNRIAEERGRQIGNLCGHGRGKQQGLSIPRQLGDHLFDIVDEAHVQHPVGLVQYEHGNIFETAQALRDQIVEPARRRHQNARFARLEVGQGVLACALRLVPVYHTGSDPRPGSTFLIRSAPCLVREKTSAETIFLSFINRSTSSFPLFPLSTK